MRDFAANLPPDFDLTNDKDEILKSVKFNLKPTIHLMCTWTFAYNQARKGGWEMIVRDRIRFQRRIKEVHVKLDHVLESNHRDIIYKLRFSGEECALRNK